jgi:hypothetical protein
MKIPAKLKKLVLNDDDLLIVSVGDVKQDIIPTTKDLEEWHKALQPLFKKRSCGIGYVVVPPYVKFQVLKALRRGDKK